MSLMKRLRSLGPGALVAAAIIGPGTVTTASKAGAEFGLILLWALLFSIVTTVILQDMCVRLGLITQESLGQTLRKQFEQPILKFFCIALIFSAIVIGSAAYQAGNLAGAVMGAELLLGKDIPFLQVFFAILIALTLCYERYRYLEILFKFCIALMSACFILTAIIMKPSLPELLSGLFIFQLPNHAVITCVALIGTTVVPYNLFLHTSLVQQRWQQRDHLPEARKDSAAALIITGLISMSIVITAAHAFPPDTQITSAQQMAHQLEPTLGIWAGKCFAIGLCAAGFTSAITAPLAAAYASSTLFKQEIKQNHYAYKLTWGFVLVCGVIISLFKINPTKIILFAQYANGLLLPMIAIFLLYIMNNKSRLGPYRNGWISNFAGIIVCAVSIMLALRSFGVLF